MTVGGHAYALPTWVRPTSGTDGGVSLASRIPTPTLGGTLIEAVSARTIWPTPTTTEAKSDTLNVQNRIDKGKQVMLCHAVRMIQTPSATQHKGSSPAALTRKDGKDRTFDRLDHYAMATAGGSLNPTWVEWLMGWPLGWTVSRHWATVKSLSKPRSRGES
jgi:hypothetical protein